MHTFTAHPFTFRIFDKFQQLNTEHWNQITQGQDIFVSNEYLQACENARMPGLDFKYLLAYENHQPVAALYFQISNLSDPGLGGVLNLQNYGLITGNVVARLNKFLFEPERGTTHIVCCGNLLLSGDHGIFTVSNDVFARLLFVLPHVYKDITKKLGTGCKAVAWMAKDFSPHRELIAQPALSKTFFRLNTDPVMVLHLEPEWKTFKDYLNALSSKYRIRANAASAKLEGVTVKDLSLAEIISWEQQIGMLLDQVTSKAPVKLVRPTTRYFHHLKEAFGKNYDFRGYFIDNEMIAFTSGLWSGNSYEAHYIGLDYEQNKQYALYQNMLYGFIDDAVRKIPGGSLYFGRTALEIKSTVGAKPVEMGCYLRLDNRIFNSLAKPVIGKTGPANWIPRDPFKNGDEA